MLEVQHAGRRRWARWSDGGAGQEVIAADWQKVVPQLAAAAERLSMLARVLVESDYARPENQMAHLLNERPSPTIESKVVPVYSGTPSVPTS